MLISLDENYSDRALALLRVPQVLLKQLCFWYPVANQIPEPNKTTNQDSESTSQPAQATESSLTNQTLESPQPITAQQTDDIARDIFCYVKDFYQTKLTADNIEVSPEDSNYVEDEDVEDVEESKDEPKKQTPLFISLTKKVWDRKLASFKG